MTADGVRIALLGGGRMGEAILAGMLRGGRRAGDVVVAERSDERAAELSDRYGVALAGNGEAAADAAVVVLAVKPQDMAQLLDEIAGGIGPDTLVVSVAAGLPMSFYESHLAAGVPVVRVMPNTPLLVGEGMSALAPGASATDDHLALVESLLQPVGRTIRVTEAELDAVTAISGSGPAYFFLVVEAMIDAGEKLGLRRDIATQLVVQTAAGAAAMLRYTDESPASLREAVTSKGGTTAAALAELEAADLRGTFTTALDAAARRSRELADELSAESDE